MRSSSFFLTVCVASYLVVNADIMVSTPVGQMFVYELKRDVFQSEFKIFQTDFIPYQTHYGPITIHPMAFKCNKKKFPDLPAWLRFTQRHTSENGFLYGTPLEENLGRNTIEITVINKQTYDTFRERLVITVTSPGKIMPYQAEFFIPLRDIEQVLPTTIQEDIKSDISRMWGTQDLEYVNITSALDRGGRVPLPLAGRFEGVYVKLGTEQPFSKCLMRLANAGHKLECEAEGQSSGDCSFCLYSSNCVDWCKSVLVDTTPVLPTIPPTPGSGILEAGEFYDPPESLPMREYLSDYLVTVIVPLVVALILCLILTYIMCCRREGVEKRDAKTSDIQLYHQRTIHSNSDELRNMADGRASAPPPLSTLPMFNARTGERMPPLQRPSRTDTSQVPLITAQEE